jgi:predicted translin family RNA/ssDNA-binding protein
MPALLLNWRLWGALGLVGALVAGYFWHAHQIDEVYKRGYNAAKAEDRDAAVQLSMKLQKEKDDAVKAAEIRAAVLQGALARADAATGRVSDLLSEAQRRLATAPVEAVRDYATTANAVFGECVKEYRAMGAAAQGHANDVQTLIEAWPKK